MPDVSVREMSAFERRRHSLAARTFRATAMTCILLGLVLLVIGLGLYGVSLTRQYVAHAFYLSQSTAVTASRDADIASLAREVMETYRTLDEDERAKTGTGEYRERFSAALDSPDYALLLGILPTFNREDNVSDVYLAMYDEATCAMVYIVDPSGDDPLCPGDWESVTEKGMRKFLDWDGTGMLYDIGHTANYGWLCTAGTPVRDEAGEVCAFALVDVTIGNVLHGMRSYTLQITVALVLVILVLSRIMVRHMNRTLVQPINKIAQAAQAYVWDRRRGSADTEHFASLNIRTGDEVENLSLVMADMERDLTEYEEDLARITAEKERISTEMALAARIQADMLPNIFPPFPDRDEFDLHAVMDPAREVGGDFYDFFLIDDDHLCLIMADVSGKGVPAALFMMASRIILANNAMSGKSPAQILTDTNEAICSNNREEMFITVWLGILEISTGKLTAASAGHEYPALRRADGSFELYKDRHGLVIGAMSGVPYREYVIELKSGDRLFTYTDGVPEATDPDEAMFGTDRMLAALNEAPGGSVEEIEMNVRRAVDGFVRGAEQFDDLTMLCLEYKGKNTTQEGTAAGKRGS